MVEVIFKTFPPIMGYMVKIDIFPYELSEIFIFGLLPISLEEIWKKNLSSIAKIKFQKYYI